MSGGGGVRERCVGWGRVNVDVDYELGEDREDWDLEMEGKRREIHLRRPLTMASVEKQLEEQLREAGNKLLDPPSSVDELLPMGA
ncbi:hypothetical protein PIB30_017740 [Stylosanthes scabra]|uniref:Uncharacterized protein n=1 Tax=Stylosanthes scabra TaxID=79078 RepID=A0ABU6S8E5_9FABA|nr:hypothetical protein [Stylosanthes scabra]